MTDSTNSLGTIPAAFHVTNCVLWNQIVRFAQPSAASGRLLPFFYVQDLITGLPGDIKQQRLLSSLSVSLGFSGVDAPYGAPCCEDP